MDAWRGQGVRKIARAPLVAEWICDTPWRRLKLRICLADSLHCKVIFESEGIQDLLEPVRIPPLFSTNACTGFVRDSNTTRVLLKFGLSGHCNWNLQEMS